MKSSASVRDHLEYAVDRVFSRGGSAMLLALFVVSALLVACAGITLTFWGIHPPDGQPLPLWEATWSSLMRTLDPGTMGSDEGWGFRGVMFAVTLGGIFVLSALIGTVTSSIEARFDKLGKGRGRVVESGHTLILGWSHQVFTLIDELVLANENRPRGRIVVLGDEDKTRMEDMVRAQVPDTLGTRLIFRTGSAIDPGDLDIASVDTARSIIVVAPDLPEPDSEVIKTILAITQRNQRRKAPCHVVAAVQEEANVRAALIASGAGNEVELVRSCRAVARVIAQTCRQPGLSTIYNELLQYRGDEIYFQHEPGITGHTYAEALLRYEDSAVIGLCRHGRVAQLNPSPDTIIEKLDEIVAISADDDTVRLAPEGAATVDESAMTVPGDRTRDKERVLMLGWNLRAPVIIGELDHYVAPGSTMTVVTAQQVGAAVMETCCPNLANLGVDFRQADPSQRQVLSELPLEDVDHVVLLSDSAYDEPQRADARCLLSILHLRDLRARRELDFSLVSEVRDPRNQRLAEASERADDFVISDRLVSQIMAQVSENKALNAILIDLFEPDGSEIYMKPAADYVELGRDVTFYSVVASASRRGETAIGYRRASNGVDSSLGRRVDINPPKSELIRFEAADSVIALAEE